MPLTRLGAQAYLLNCSVTLALFFTPTMYSFTTLWAPLLCLVPAILLSYYAGQILIALTDLSLTEVISDGPNIRLLRPSTEQRNTVLDIPTLVSHNARSDLPYAISLYFSLLVTVEMSLVCCNLLIYHLNDLWQKLAVVMLFPAMASILSLCSVERMEKLEVVLAACRVGAMLFGAAAVLTGNGRDIGEEEQFAFLSVSLWLFNYHVPSCLFLSSRSPHSQMQIHVTTLAISALFCSALVLVSYFSTTLTGANTYRTVLLCLLPIALLSTANIYLRTFSQLLCAWRYGSNRRELETRYSYRVKLIKIIAPWPLFLISAIVEIVYFGEVFRRLFLSFIINGPIATVVLYWILAYTYEKRFSQLGLLEQSVSKWATRGLRWVPGLMTAFGVIEMVLLPGFKMSFFVQPRLLMPFGVDFAIFVGLILWRMIGR